LRAQSEERQDLLADVTHELRTPLTVLQGNLEGMLDGVYPRDEAHLQSSLDETRILADLVEDLRTLALAERSALELRVEATDLAQLVSETVTSFRPAADAKGVALEVAAQDLPPVEVDPLRMRQVLTNLLANALQFTGGGDRVSIRVYAGSTDDVAIEVDDSGPGIQAEELPRIFDRFYKSPDSAGTGLGLAIAAQLVHAHGGEIHAQSEPGHGTRMTVTLPA
jgi:signal transduction histidine kinase